ncbi:MAG TPA: hypothetical protein VD863_06900 [Bradyrhizobium sp.]|nr:hypothetical protein [Bradyrhizobium sp.]
MALVTPYLDLASVSVTAASVNLVVNSANITSQQLRAGDQFMFAGLSVPITAVAFSSPNTNVTLAYGWPGATLSAASGGKMFRVPDVDRQLQANIDVLNAMISNIVVALSTQAPAANKFPYFDASAAAQLGDVTAAGRALLAAADALAQRTAMGLGFAGLSSFTDTDAAADFIYVMDTSANAIKKALGGAFSKSKVISATRDMSLTGTQAITGVGFKPRAVLALGMENSQNRIGFGMSDGTTHRVIYTTATGAQSFSSHLFRLRQATNDYLGSFTSFDADGMTITWSHSASANSGTIDQRLFFFQ